MLIAHLKAHLVTGETVELLPVRHETDVKKELTGLLEGWAKSGFLVWEKFVYPWHQVQTIEVTVENLSSQPMPLSLGYHPYFQLNDSPRDEWKVTLAARESVVLSNLLVPTGERKPIEFSNPYPLAGRVLDNVFTGLTGGDWATVRDKAEWRGMRGKRFAFALL